MADTTDVAPRRIRIDEFAHFHYVGALRVTADERAVVYALSTVNMQANAYETDLWTLDLATGARRRLTSSGKEGHFDLLDDGSVLFASGRAKAAAGTAGGAWAPADAARVTKAVQAGETPAEADVVALGYERGQGQLAEDPAAGTDLYRIALDGGEATLFAHVPLEVADWRQLDAHRLVLLARGLRDSAAPYATLVDVPFWSNGDTYHSGLRWGVYLLDTRELGGSPDRPVARPRLLTGAHEGVDGWELSPDRATLYYFSNDYQAAAPVKTALRAIDVREAATAAPRTATGASPEAAPAPDGPACPIRTLDRAPRMFYQGIACATAADGTPELLLLATDMATHGLNEEPYAYVCDAADGARFRRVVGDDFFADVFNAVGSDCRHGRGREQVAVNGALLFLRSVGDSSRLTRVTTSGEVADLIDGEGSVETIDTLDGRTLYYVAMRPNMLPEIYRRTVDASGATVAPEERLTDYSAHDLAGLDVADYETFDFQSGGDTLTGYVLRPVGYAHGAGPLPGGTYPGILWVHGGPKCTQGKLLFHELQYLRGLGYYVFFTNPHGAGGRSREFMDIFGHYGEQDYADLMTFTDEVLARYDDLAADHLAEMGGSYGGFMTNWIIGHTDRFRCANSQRSISNWTSKFGVADIGYYFNNDQTKGDPWNHVERMWEQSPLRYADRCVTPTLFLHSDCDYRCPLDQGLQMFTALQLHGCPARMVVFKGENHDLSRGGRPQARVRRLAEISDWDARWLKDEPAGEPALHAARPASAVDPAGAPDGTPDSAPAAAPAEAE